MTLFIQLALGSLMIAATTFIHATALDFIIKTTGKVEISIRRHKWNVWKPLVASIVVLAVFLSHVAQIWLWAGLFLKLSCAPLVSLSDALYFATVTYTTLGYGDITLDTSCRMLSGVEATNGLIMFGWTTAFIFEVISRLYRREAHDL